MASPIDTLNALVAELIREFPGVTFGYIGNVGVDRSGPYDDRSWYIFLPHPGRVGTFTDRVGGYRTDRLAVMVEQWPRLVEVVRQRLG